LVVSVLFVVHVHRSSQALTSLFEYDVLHVKPVSECVNDVDLLVHVEPLFDHSYFVAVHHPEVHAHVILVCASVFVHAVSTFNIFALQLAVVHQLAHVHDHVYVSVPVVTVPAVHALHLSVVGADTLDFHFPAQHVQFIICSHCA
jgi:hypothetical protein